MKHVRVWIKARQPLCMAIAAPIGWVGASISGRKLSEYVSHRHPQPMDWLSLMVGAFGFTLMMTIGMAIRAQRNR